MVPPLNDPSLTKDGVARGAKMHTIAGRLDLSVATVSRALRGVAGINAQTRARVIQAVAQLGYQPPQNFREQARQSGTLRHIAALVQTPRAHVAAPDYLVGRSEAEAAMGMNASLVVHHVTPEQCGRLLKFSRRGWLP